MRSWAQTVIREDGGSVIQNADGYKEANEADDSGAAAPQNTSHEAGEPVHDYHTPDGA